jgi:uncharacterized protein (TIGR02284 family)
MGLVNNKDILARQLLDLIKINNNRIEGYQKAGEQANTSDLKNLFNSKVEQSREFVLQLRQFVAKINGEQLFDSQLPGELYHSWMEFTDTLTQKGSSSIVRSCEFGEAATLEAYDKALLSKADMSATILHLITEQQKLIRESYAEIKALKDVS